MQSKHALIKIRVLLIPSQTSKYVQIKLVYKFACQVDGSRAEGHDERAPRSRRNI